MSFFSDSHKLVPEPETQDYSYCKGSIDNVSFSGLQIFETCPYHLYLNKVSKIPGTSNAASSRGTEIHDMLENYVNGTLDETEIKWTQMKSQVYHQNLINTFRKDYETGLVIPEFKYAITRNLKPCKWDAKNMWHRGAIDVVLFKDSTKKQAIIFDYKTGKNDKTVVHRSQLMLYAMMMFLHFKQLNDISSSPIYLDHKQDPFYTSFKRSDFDLFWPRWETRLSAVTEAKVFPARPNKFNCQWCPHKATREDINQTEPACAFGVI